jgi:FkbH-like protein
VFYVSNILNLNKVVAQIGVSNSFDQRLYNSSKAPYSFLFFKSYVDSLTNILLKNTALLKKAIIFDCDNTLWSGIIGEEEIDFSKDSYVGKHFYKVQQVIKFLSKNGIIIGLNSKNNEKDVLPFLNEINGILTNEDITIYKINWDNKINNLLQIAKDLNISLDSIIFIDDSSFEIQLVNSKLPEILTMQVPKKLYLYPKFLLNIVEKYCNLNFNKDDLNKNLMYKQEFDRKHLLTKVDNINDYLKTLEIEIDIKINDKNNIIRLSQLSLKTNQFNLTNKRYTESEFYNLMNSNNYLIFSLFVKDKFGESGTTGIIIIQQDQLSKTAIIENYLLSCRILGREIEIVFMNCIIEYLQNINFKILKATYIKSNKNNQVIEFYDKIGFKILSDEDNYSKLYQLNLEKYISKDCNNIKINKLWIKN